MKDQSKLTPLQKLLSVVRGQPDDAEPLEKALPPRRDDDKDDDDDGAPSTEDREKAAAPAAPVGRNDGAPDGDDDADDDDAAPDDDANGDADADPDDDDGNKEPDEQAPPAAPPGKKRPPMPLRKAIEEIDDDEVRAEIRRRAQDSPDFLKSLLGGEDAADILEAIDMSAVVAQIVQSASETIAAKDIQIAALTKSLAGMAASYDGLVETSNALCEGLAKSIEQQADLLKGLGEVRGDVLLVKAQDNGKVSHGQGTLVAPKREDPGKAAPEEETGPDALPEGMNMARINRALMKSVEDGTLTRDEGRRYMDSVGSSRAQNQRVWRKLPPNVREVALAVK
jgi:hypothetical protein